MKVIIGLLKDRKVDVEKEKNGFKNISKNKSK
jgi:hypothetical protein